MCLEGTTKMIEQKLERDVAVVKCNSYDKKKVEKAVRQALSLIKFDPLNGTKVLIKPNGVMTSADCKKQEAITTHLTVLEAICKILKENKCKIYIGESSFTNTACVMKKLGYDALAKKYKAKLIIFEQNKLVDITDNNAVILKKFEVSQILKEVDYIIDVPKMKTHSLAHVTLGIKNLYGIIPGGLKQRLHNQAHGDKFADILVDIYQNFKPQLTILDAIVGMEGEGPSNGDSKKVGLILASKNTVALDVCASTIMGYNPDRIPTISTAIKRGLYPDYKFNLLGMKKLPIVHFKRPFIGKYLARVFSIFKEKPIVCNKDKCIKCCACMNHCPVKAISMKPFPEIDKSKCIRCFCCMEICPSHALSLGGKEFS